MEDLTSKDILEAVKMFNLGDKASIKEIKNKYKKLVKEFHPDKNTSINDKDIQDRIREINNAYKVLLTYCEGVDISFDIDTIKRSKLVKDWWLNRFGKDPLWGK